MKKLGLLLVGSFLVGLIAQTVSARLPYKKEAEAKWGESKIAEIMKEEKCTFCHHPKDKKIRNDLGKALAECGLSKEKYTELKGDKEKLSEFIKDALGKALKKKNADGKTFGELIKAGEDPSENLEVEE